MKRNESMQLTKELKILKQRTESEKLESRNIQIHEDNADGNK